MAKTEKKLRDDIRTIRKSLKISQKEMGDKLGMAESSYSRIESGEIAISYAHLVAISEAFGMSIPELLAYPASNNTNRETCTERKNLPTKIMVELEIDEGELIKVRLKDNIYQITQ